MPPSPFLHTDKGAIAVTKRRESSEPTNTTTFQAPSKTMAHLKAKRPMQTSVAQASTDPWSQGSDPWANYRQAGAGGSTMAIFPQNKQVAAPPKKRFDEMEERTYSRVQDQWRKKQDEDVPMEPHPEVMIQQSKLQVEIDELRAQNTKFEGWFQETGNRMGAVEQHLQQQGAQIVELGQAVKTQATATTHIQHELGSFQSLLREELATAMASQSSKLEALLEKRHKTN